MKRNIKRNNNNLLPFYIIASFVIITIIFIFNNLDKIEDKIKDKNEYKSNKTKNKIDTYDMFNLFQTRNIGYPNSYQAYVMCYVNSALQLLRTSFSSFYDLLSPEILTLFNSYINTRRPANYLNDILKLILPNNAVRKDAFYTENNTLRQSDSFEFLYYLLDYIFYQDQLRQIKYYFKFDILEQLAGDNGRKIGLIEEIILKMQPSVLNTDKLQINIQDLFNVYINGIEEKIGDFRDDDNKYGTNIMKKLTYVNFSEYLLINIVLFRYNKEKKNTEKLQYYTIIDKLSFQSYNMEYLSSQTYDKYYYEYIPISIICHSGNSVFSGHYINYSKRPKTVNGDLVNADWWLYNDDQVSLIGDSLDLLNNAIFINKSQPYIILYKQIVKKKID